MARHRKRRSDEAPNTIGGRTGDPWSATASAIRGGSDGPELEHRQPGDEHELGEAREQPQFQSEDQPRELDAAAAASNADPAAGEARPVTGDDQYDEYDEEYDDGSEEYEEQVDDQGRGGRGSGAGRGRRGGGGDSDGESGGEGAIVPARPSTPTLWIGARVLQFLQGSWRELQRVQWPDRPQVMQATGVVIGFVIVAGVFLGVSDFLATKLVNFILK
ncbi:MAG: preprotein translocase subunit SecE [Solirubrobacteraceae bacterium]